MPQIATRGPIEQFLYLCLHNILHTFITVSLYFGYISG